MMLASTSLSSVVSLAASAFRQSSSSPPRVRPEVEVLSELGPLLSSPRFDANRQSRDGDTLLHTAARSNHARVVDVLLRRCPQLRVDVRNIGGFTALDFAGRSGNVPIMHALIAAGADPWAIQQPRNSKSRLLLLHPSLSAQQVSAVVAAGRLEYRRRLFARLSEPGTTGTAYFPPELQAIIADYAQ